MTRKYVVKKANYDGYNQAFYEISTWNDVEDWLADGSIELGDIIYELVAVEQPNKQEKD